MIFPNTMPTDLAGMMTIIEPLVTYGIFDSIAYDDPDTPTEIRCSKNSVRYLTILPYSVHGFVFNMHIPAVGGNDPIFQHILTEISNAATCKGGAYFFGLNSSKRFVIAKSHSGKPVFICGSDFATLASMHTLKPSTYPCTNIGMHVRSYDDNPDLTLYKYGYFTSVMCNSATPDKTMLQYIPISGERGSTDYFETVFIRVIPQYYEDGEQIIDGKKYGCIDVFAFSDEADE